MYRYFSNTFLSFCLSVILVLFHISNCLLFCSSDVLLFYLSICLVFCSLSFYLVFFFCIILSGILLFSLQFCCSFLFIVMSVVLSIILSGVGLYDTVKICNVVVGFGPTQWLSG